MPRSPEPPAGAAATLAAAVAHHRAGDLAAAVAGYRVVLSAAPKNADALHLLGVALHQQGDNTAALALIIQARALRPQSADMAYNMGRVCLALRDWPMAAEANRAALALDPAMSAAWCNLGIALVRLGRAGEAEAAIRTAIGGRADNAASWSALGVALLHQDRGPDAEAAWETALARDPAFAEARFNLATARLKRRDFAQGWPLFAAREAADPTSFASGGRWPAAVPRWQGGSLKDRAVLLWGEQGLGDQILFAGLIPDLEAKAITLACAPRLVPLFARAWPELHVVPQPTAAAVADGVDTVLPLGDLGGLLRTHTPWPAPRAYLRADPARAAALRARYAAWAKGRPLVGVSWHSHRASLGRLKSLPLVQWASALAGTPAAFVSLQYGDVEADLAEAGRAGFGVHQDPEIDPSHDLDGLAAQIAAMDLVLTVSNTTAHLAGALGVETWVMAPRGAGGLWYWFRPETPYGPSPWYARLRVYPQQAGGDWSGMLQCVRVDLEAFCTGAKGA